MKICFELSKKKQKFKCPCLPDCVCDACVFIFLKRRCGRWRPAHLFDNVADHHCSPIVLDRSGGHVVLASLDLMSV